jgi:hypothetical protein
LGVSFLINLPDNWNFPFPADGIHGNFQRTDFIFFSSSFIYKIDFFIPMGEKYALLLFCSGF